MNIIDRIKQEIQHSKDQTSKLINDIDKDLWFYTPPVLKTNLNWQIGHIFLANYLHGIASINSKNEEINQLISVKDFVKFYGMGSEPAAHQDEKPSTEELLKIYETCFEIIYKGLQTMDETELDNPTARPNPAAETKYAALMWLSKHQSWHNGQIATLKRVLKNQKEV